ncbi:MAG: FG-GAP repeat protein, partial [Thermoplasmata archaeon]
MESTRREAPQMRIFSKPSEIFQKLNVTSIVLILLLGFFFGLINTENATTAINHGFNTDLTKSDIKFKGEYTFNEAGESLSFTQDINGDGIDDILIGSENFHSPFNTSSGKCYVFFGSRSPWADKYDLSDAPASFVGEKSYDRAGTITSAGDVNGDGLGDILIGAPYNDDGGGDPAITNDGAGKVYLIFGKKNVLEPDISLSNADVSFIGENAYDNIGYDISTAGDVNGDGFDDILIGTQYNDQSGQNAGKIYLILGRGIWWKNQIDLANADHSFVGENEDDRLHVVSNAGDVNKDGFDDIIFGAPRHDDGGSDTGKVYLIFGSLLGWAKNISVENAYDVCFNGENIGDHLSSVASAGDVNKDGYDDFLIGAPQNDMGGANAGKVYLIFGKKDPGQSKFNLGNANASFIGENADDYCVNIAGAGDVNGDGYDDFVIASQWNDKGNTNSGQTYLFLGKGGGWKENTNLQNADASFVSSQNHGYSGSMVGRYQPGDINGDGFDDLLIGEPGYSEVNSRIGQCYLFFLGINKRPSTTTKLTTYSDPAYTQTIDQVNQNETIYLEVLGEDSDPSRRNLAEVFVKSKHYDPIGITVRLFETDNNSGVFRGYVHVMDSTHLSNSWIGTESIDEITLISVENTDLTKQLPVGPRIRIDNLDLIDGDGPDGNTIYCGLKPYSIKVIVNDALGRKDIESVKLSWQVADSEDRDGSSGRSEEQPPEIHTITLAWFQENDNFTIIEAPEGWLSLVESVSQSTSDQNIYELYFNVMFHWSYPTNITTAISVYSTSKQLIPQGTNLTKPDNELFFKSINKVHLVGDLKVTGEIQGSLNENDIVLAGEKLTWTGLRAAYIDNDNKEIIYAAPGSTKVQIKDSFDSSWQTDISKNENITLSTITPDNDYIEVIYRFNLINIPEFCDLTDISYTLTVTGIEPGPPSKFEIHADGFYDENIYADNDNELFLTWQPPEGHQWDIEGYYFSFSNLDLPSNGFWTTENSGLIYLSSDYSELEGGIATAYVLAKDIYGSIGTLSSASILIDTRPVEFSNVKPAAGTILAETEVEVSVLISDKDGSGVKGNSISYRKSTTGLDGYGSWINYNNNNDGSMIICTLTTTFEQGTDNYIQWRAKDTAGNGYTLSDNYNININIEKDNIPPTVSLLSPENDTKISNNLPILYWKGTDFDGDTIYYDVYFSSDYDKVAELDNSVLVATNLPDTEFVSPVPLENKHTYYWTVIPNDNIKVGSCLMNIWCFHIDITLSTSSAKLFLPHDNSIISNLKPTLMWTGDYEGTSSVILSYDVYLDSNPNPVKIVSASQLESSFTPLFPLKNGQTYYWKIIPSVNGIKGKCESGVWMFKIDLNFSYEINLNSDYSRIKIEQGDFKSIGLYISNKGNQPDTIKLTLHSDDLDEITLNSTNVLLPRTEQGLATLSIHIPKDMKTGTYTITITAVSEGARVQGQDVND